ncbi:phytanoyl-CoA dioxygenase [bacterium]|nr:phytanoyl-CoA dioxygenase [bacterium]
MVVVKVADTESTDNLFDRVSVEKISAGFLQDGWLSINSVISLDALNLAQREIQGYISGIEERNRNGFNLQVGDKRYMEIIKVCPPFDDCRLLAAPKVLQVLISLLGEDLVLNSYTSVISLPGSQDQGVHRDGEPLFGESICASLPPHAITVAIPLVDIDKLCGSTAIWGRSHIEEFSAVKDQNGALLPATAPFPKLGDVYMFDYRLKHAGMANHSSLARPILYIVFSKPWWIDPINFRNQKPVAISKADLTCIPSRIKSLFRLVDPL